MKTKTDSKKNNIIVKVRKAKVNDIPSIMELYKAEDWLGDNNSIERIAKNYNPNSKYNYLFVAEYNGDVIGTITFSINKAYAFDCMSYGVFDYLVVEKKYRRKGVGAQLIDKLTSIAQENNLESIYCVSSSTRSSAHKFYDCTNFNDKVKGFRKRFV